jgi:hypothetical protein
MADKYQDDGAMEAAEFLKRHPEPLILRFQPQKFRVIEDSEKLKEWEIALRERVGLPVQDAFGNHVISRMETCCESDCPSLPQSGDNLDTDDCDID